MEAKENGVAVTDLADLQRQLNEATEKVARLEKMIKNVKAEKEDLAKENYDLHRTASSYRKRLGEMGIWAKSVSACSTHLQKVVSEIFVQSVEDANPKAPQQKAAPVVKVASVSATISVDVSEKKAKPKAASQASAPVVNRVEALPPVSKVTSTPKTAPSAQSPPIAVPAPPKPIVQVLAAPKLVPAPKVVPAQAQQPKSAAPSVKASAAPPLVKTLAQAPSAHSTPIAGQRVQAVSKPTLHVAATPKTVPAPSNPPKRPPLKHIEITPSQTLHIKQMAEAGRKAIDAAVKKEPSVKFTRDADVNRLNSHPTIDTKANKLGNGILSTREPVVLLSRISTSTFLKKTGVPVTSTASVSMTSANDSEVKMELTPKSTSILIPNVKNNKRKAVSDVHELGGITPRRSKRSFGAEMSPLLAKMKPKSVTFVENSKVIKTDDQPLDDTMIRSKSDTVTVKASEAPATVQPTGHRRLGTKRINTRRLTVR